MARYDTPGLTWDMPGLFYDMPETPLPGGGALTPKTHSTTAMEFWEITKERAQQTLPVWNQHTATLKIGGLASTDLEGFIDQFEPLVQERTLAQDDADAAYREIQTALLKMKILGTKVPQLIEGHLDENEGIMRDVDDLYRTTPRSEATILKRARELYPVWVRANAALAAMTPAQPPIVRVLQGTPVTAPMLKALLDGYTTLVKTSSDKQETLDGKRAALRALDRATDQLNKRWYKVVKASNDPGSDVYEALGGITTEPGTPAPETIEIATVTQGGEDGLHALVAYVPGGGDHATTRTVKWQVVGVDAGFTQNAPLDASGNALGPFAVGMVVKIITEVANSAGVRTTAPRTITMAVPVT